MKSNKAVKLKTPIWVLVVDDDPEIRGVLKNIFQDSPLPLKIIEASDGAEAIWRISNQKFSLMIMDLKMPKVDGNALLKELTKISPEARPDEILVLSAYMDEFKFSPFENITYLEKPSGAEILLGYLKDTFRDKSADEGLSLIGFKFLHFLMNSTIHVLSVTFGVKARFRALPLPGANLDDGYQVYAQFKGEKVFGYLRMTVDKNLMKELMKKPLETSSPEEAHKAVDAVSELLNQVFGIARVQMNKVGLKTKGEFPILIKGTQELPVELRAKRPALAHCVAAEGALRLEVMIEPI